MRVQYGAASQKSSRVNYQNKAQIDHFGLGFVCPQSYNETATTTFSYGFAMNTEQNDNRTRAKIPLLIAVEGIDGSGKSTAMPCLSDAMSDMGYAVALIREPYGSLDYETLKGDALIEAFVNDRVNHLKTMIKPFLAHEGHAVITDRYLYSNIAYQGTDHDKALDIVQRNLKANVMEADIMLLMDLPALVAQDRILRTRGHILPFEKEHLSHASEMFRLMNDRHAAAVRVDAANDAETVRNEAAWKLSLAVRLLSLARSHRGRSVSLRRTFRSEHKTFSFDSIPYALYSDTDGSARIIKGTASHCDIPTPYASEMFSERMKMHTTDTAYFFYDSWNDTRKLYITRTDKDTAERLLSAIEQFGMVFDAFCIL